MVSHKPSPREVRTNLQEMQPANVRISQVHLGSTVYERKQGVMRMIGWRMKYWIITYQFESGVPVETSAKSVESVFIK
jgi:hypothetical protein